MIRNPSFEQTCGKGLEGWELQGGPPGDFIGEEKPHSGKRFIKFKPTGSRLSWSSEPIRVKSGTRYGLSWWMRIDGVRPWHWTYLTNFTGIDLDFFSEDGSQLDADSRRIRCLRTADWKRAWVTFESPAESATVRISFVLDSPTHIEMHMDVDDVELEEIPDNPTPGLGKLAILAFENGKNEPTFARFFVEDLEGISKWPKYSYTFKSGLFYHLNDPQLNYIDLPPGRYHVRATKGPEFDAVEEEVEVQAGKIAQVDLALKRISPMTKREWYGGDHHVHLFFHTGSTHPQMTIDDVMKIAKGEGLNFVSFCGEWSEFIGNMGNHEIARDRNFVGEVGLESVNDFYGHMCTMGWASVPDQGIPMRCVAWPMNTDTIESLSSMGGAWVNAHPFDRITPGKIVKDMADPEKLCNARELPVILALGHRTNFDILCHATPGGAELKTAEYYRLLNMGFKVGITASTDFYVDQARGTPGHNRTYVRAVSLDFNSIAEGYRNGRTYATNCPLVWFQVDGAKIGDELEMEASDIVKAKLTAFSRMGLDRAKIVVNGKVFRVIDAEDRWIDQEFEIPIKESSWVAVHVEGPVNNDIEPWDLTPDQRNLKSQFAHTSPVYIRVGNKPIKPSIEDVKFLTDWLDAALQAFHSLDRLWEGHTEEPYLASSYSEDDRKRITATFEERIEKAKSALKKLLD